MRPLPREELGLLGPVERVAYRFADTINRYDILKESAQMYMHRVGSTWVTHCTTNLATVRGVEHVARVSPDRGVILTANHRSFFDLYLTASHFVRVCPWLERMFFPVRADFFYDKPAGTIVNAIMSGMSMYPPIYRDPARRGLNHYAVEMMAQELQRPKSFVGMHPEGKRGQGPDPYELLPAQYGVGHIAHASRVPVIPAFIVGLSNDLPKQVRGNFDGTGAPVTLGFGAPVDLDDLLELPAEMATYKRIAERIRGHISALGAEDRAFRARRGMPAMGPTVSPIEPQPAVNP